MLSATDPQYRFFYSSPDFEEESYPSTTPYPPSAANDPFAKPIDVRPVQISDLSLEGDLSSVPLDYILSKLLSLGPKMLEASANASVKVPSSQDDPRPSRLGISLPSHVNPSLKPTQVIAVTGHDKPSLTLLQPVFGLVSAAGPTEQA